MVRLPDPTPHAVSGGLEAHLRALRDCVGELPQFGPTLRLQMRDAWLEASVGSGEPRQREIVLVDGCDCRAIGFEIRLLAGQQVSALPGLGVFQLRHIVREQRPELVAALDGSLPCLQLRQTHHQHDTAPDHERDQRDEQDDQALVHREPGGHPRHRTPPEVKCDADPLSRLWYGPCYSSGCGDWFTDAISRV